jgi:hypothetical protein
VVRGRVIDVYPAQPQLRAWLRGQTHDAGAQAHHAIGSQVAMASCATQIPNTSTSALRSWSRQCTRSAVEIRSSQGGIASQPYSVQ